MKFTCKHQEINQEVTPFRCIDCGHLGECNFFPDEFRSCLENIQKVKNLLLENSIKKEDLGPNNEELWQEFWGLKWKEYAMVIRAFRSAAPKTSPRPRKIKQELDDLIKLTGQLKTRLNDLSALWSWQASPLVNDDHAFDLYSQLIPMLDEFKTILSKAGSDIPIDRGGPSENLQIKFFVKKLARLWQEITRKKPTYTGAFLKFVQLSCDMAKIEYQSANALGQNIRRTLRNRK